MRKGGLLLAAMVVLGAILPGSAVAAGDALQRVGSAQIDRQGILLPDKWVSITESGAVWDVEGWRGDYSWTIPSSIPPSGATATLTVKATDKVGGRFYPVMGLSGNLFFDPNPPQVTAGADLNAGKPTDTGTKTIKLTPGSYCDTCPITLTVGIQDGPRITFTYKVVPKPKGVPCKAGAITRIASFNGPLLCHVDEPEPGRTGRVTSSALDPRAKTLTVAVSSSSGSLSGTTIVGEAEAKRRRAEKIGEIVAACFLIGEDAFDYPSEMILQALDAANKKRELLPFVNAASRLNLCIVFAKRLVELEGSRTSARAAARGCHTRRIAFAPRVRKGKVVGLKLAKSQRPSSSSVRYSCTGARGGAKVTVKGPGALRSSVGKKLDLGIVRSPSAPSSGATLSFRFR